MGVDTGPSNEMPKDVTVLNCRSCTDFQDDMTAMQSIVLKVGISRYVCKPNLYTDRTTRRCWTTETGKQPLKSTNGMGNQPARRPVQVPVDIAGHFLGLSLPPPHPLIQGALNPPTFQPPVPPLGPLPPLPSIQETWRNPPFQQPTPLPGLSPIPPTIQKPQRPAMFQCPVPPPMRYPIPQPGLAPNHNTMQIPLMFQPPVPLPMPYPIPPPTIPPSQFPPLLAPEHT